MHNEVYVLWLPLVMEYDVEMTFLKWGWYLEVSAVGESFLSFSFKEHLVKMLGHC